MSHQTPLPLTPAEAIESALTVASLALATARTPTQRRQALDRIQELKRERALIALRSLEKAHG